MEKQKQYILNHIVYTLIQLTWGICQNAFGILLFLILTIINPKRKRKYYHGAIMSYWKFPFSMGLGMFIFFGHSNKNETYQSEVLVHEFGHTIQSCILGPLFMFVIGIPSFLWAFIPCFVKMRKEGKYSYLEFYPEKWANYEGERVLHMNAPKERLADQVEETDK